MIKNSELEKEIDENKKMTIAIKIHRSYRAVVAICDIGLIGKKFEEGNRQLDCKETFYKERSLTYKEAVEIMKRQLKEDATFNIIGENSIKAAIEAGLIKKENIDRIQKIPFALKLL